MDIPDQHERFMRLFLPHEPELLRTVLMFVPHQADARDIVQETAIALWKHFPDYDPSRPFGGWACGFARMEVKRFLRRAHRQAYLAEEAAEVLMEMEETSVPIDEERERHLADCRAQLRGDHRRLLDGYYLEDVGVDTLAQRHGRSVEAVYKMLQRIRASLLECVDRKMAGGRP